MPEISGYAFPNDIHVHWSLMIVMYPYLTGFVAGSFIVTSLYHLFGKQEFAPVARLALGTSFSFLLVAFLPLLLRARKQAIDLAFGSQPVLDRIAAVEAPLLGAKVRRLFDSAATFLRRQTLAEVFRVSADLTRAAAVSFFLGHNNPPDWSLATTRQS